MELPARWPQPASICAAFPTNLEPPRGKTFNSQRPQPVVLMQQLPQPPNDIERIA